MRNLILYSVIAITIIACKNDDDANGYSWGTASALKNGGSWIGEPFASNAVFPGVTGIEVGIRSAQNVNSDKELLIFYNVPLQLDKFNISKVDTLVNDSLTCVMYLPPLLGDVITDYYHLSEVDNFENYIEITEITGDEIKGSFQVSFLRDTTSLTFNSLSLDTILFTEGQFHTRIRQ